MISSELTAEQHGAIDAPFEECFAILGGPATGKSAALAQRLARVRELYPNAQPLVIGSPRSLDDYAAELLRSRGLSVTIVDDIEAELIFLRACSPLFELRWPEFAKNQLDPEVPGLRSPERFMQSAFRLIRRLRDADVDPALLLSRALAAATEFYANPPNLADPRLLLATKTSYHDSLEVTPQELMRQYRRELDLAKILAKLYEDYAALIRTGGRMTGRDAVIAAAHLLHDDPAEAARLRQHHQFAFIDDAQELTSAQLQLLSVIFGERLSGVTLCGDPSSAVDGTRKTSPQASFGLARSKAELRQEHRSPQRETFRFATQRDEADFIAERIDGWLSEGFRPERIAVLFRSVAHVATYETALLNRNIPAVVAGDVNVFADRRALDALALLWNVHDPFRHDWLLRTLSNPAFGLSDASLATLCAEPADPQQPLFAFDDEPAPTARTSRWDPKRDLRLGWNAIRGEQDDALSADARNRLVRFRELREAWLDAMRQSPFEDFVRVVWREGLAREGEPGSARARAQQVALYRLLDRLRAFLARNPEAPLSDVLDYAEQRTRSDLESCEHDGARAHDGAFVQLLSVEAARGREFDHVVIADVRPGSFPRWYSPEAFLFSPRLGMIPKENVGDARASRTAKFSYYVYRMKTAQHYYERERRAFEYALRRARRSVLVTASGAPTRGVTAPEFLEELR